MTIINFYFLLFFSIIISLSINSTFLIWLSLELNMLRFLPIISSGINVELENSMKYFLIQRWASIFFLLRFFFLMLQKTFYVMIVIRMLIKLGIAPFHTWFISILKTSSLKILVLLSSVQKLIPLIILINLKINTSLLMAVVLLNIIFILLILPITINLNKLLALSSINNVIWIIIRVIISLKLFVTFIVIYLFLIVGLMILYNEYHINIFSQINRINFFDKICMVLIFMSLGGLPPLLGFLRKFLVIKFILISSNRIYFIMIIVFSSLFLLYFYISRIYFYLTYIPSLKMNLKIRHVLIKKYLYMISLLIINSFLLVNL